MKNKFLAAPLQRLNYLGEWLRRHKEEHKIVPDIQDMYERTEWDFQTLSELPDDVLESISPGFVYDYKVGTDFIMESLPLPPEHLISAVSSTGSMSTASSSAILGAVMRAGQVEDETINLWSDKYARRYREIQKKQSRFEEVKLRLENLNPDRTRELELARQEYAAAISNEDKREAAGNAMRNVLEHYKGDLYEMARTRRKENITWERMGERLSVGDIGSIEYIELLKQEEEWGSLHGRLSEVVHGQKYGLVADLDDIWTRLLDHLYTVLGLIK